MKSDNNTIKHRDDTVDFSRYEIIDVDASSGRVIGWILLAIIAFVMMIGAIFY